MLFKTKGIVLNYIKYRETSIIVRIFTEEFGLSSYIINGVRSAKAKNKIALYQPLTLLELVVYNKKNTDLNRISEVKCHSPFVNIPTNIRKSSIAIFVTEILIKSLKAQDQNEDLYSFLEQSILILENLATRFGNFHLQFLLKLTTFLGFAPRDGMEITAQLVEAGFKERLDEEELHTINQMINAAYNEDFKLAPTSRRKILDQILKYFSLHIDNFGEVKSITILNEVLR